MINQNFSDEFDVLYNNISSNLAPGLDEYEKSVFLTKGQDEVLKAYYDLRGNKFLQGYDGSQRRLIDFSMLTKVWKFILSTTPSSTDTSEDTEDDTLINPGSTLITSDSPLFDTHDNALSISLPDDILMCVNEVVKVTRQSKENILQIVPITYDEYFRLMSKPFKRPLKNQAWRLLDSDTAKKADLVLGYKDIFKEYILRYIKRPRPIILCPLEGVSILGYVGCDSEGNLVTENATQGCECELDPILHEEILQRAVELAKAAYTGDLASTITLGLNSETNMGIVSSGGNSNNSK